MTDDAIRELAAIRRGVEGRDVALGPSATDLHARTLIETARPFLAALPVPDSVSWRHSFACAIHDGNPCNCKDDDAA
jgi:hypothetical protein